MKTVHYSNIFDRKRNRQSLVVADHIFDDIVKKCNGHFGFGGEDKNSFIVDVDHWNRCLVLINDGIKSGHYPYVKKETLFNL